MEESKKVPISEVKPIKKETKRRDNDVVEDKKDTLDVRQKKPKESRCKTKDVKSSKVQSQHKATKEEHKKDASDTKYKDERKHQEQKQRQHYKSKDDIDGTRNKEPRSSAGHKTKEKHKEPDIKSNLTNGETGKIKNGVTQPKIEEKQVNVPKEVSPIATGSKSDLQVTPDDERKTNVDPKSNGKIDMNASFKDNTTTLNAEEKQPIIQDARKIKAEHVATSSSNIIEERNIKFSETKRPLKKSSKSNKNTKPPNVLVYSDSQVTKENVKDVLSKILNKEK